MAKKLTGQMIYEYRISIKKFENFFAPDWARAGQIVQDEFNNMAVYLNEQLGLCCSCGERPEPIKLHEVAGEMICSACLGPKPEAENCPYKGQGDCDGEGEHQCPRCKKFYCDTCHELFLPIDPRFWVDTALICPQCYYNSNTARGMR